MKAILFTVLASLTCIAFGADSCSTSECPQQTNQQVPYDPTAILQGMTAKLKLSASQQDGIKPILIAEADKRKSIQADTTLSDKQKHDQIGVIHRAACQQIKVLFTADQLAQIDRDQNHQSQTSPQ